MMRRGLFLDLDGTLADSLTAMKHVYHDFLGRFGKVASDAEFDRLNGPPLRKVVGMLQATHTLPGTEESLYQDYIAMVATAQRDIAPARGAARVLMAAKAHSWIVGIVTSAAHAATDRWLRHNNLSSYVDLVVGGDDVEFGKPNPEPYLRALHDSGCAPEDSRAVEDSPQGAIASSSAGLGTWVIGPTMPEVLANRPNILGTLHTFADLSRHL